MSSSRPGFGCSWLPYALVLPQLLITAVFFLWPAGEALWYSVQSLDPFGLSSQFVGLDNFKQLFQDPYYLDSFYTTLIFSFLVAGIGLAVSLFFAALVDYVLRGSRLYRTLMILPYAVAPAIAGVLWLFMFHPTIGIVAYLLRTIGIAWNHHLNGTQALILVIIAATWRQIPYNFIFFLAGLQAIPRSLVEAAAIDGAGPARRFWTIVFPLLSPVTFFLLVINVVYAMFDTFGIIHATTGGGPAQATNILVFKVYMDGFVGQNIGSSAAQSVILMSIVIVLTVIQFRYIERKVQY